MQFILLVIMSFFCNTLDNTLEGIYFNKNTKLLLPIQCSAVKLLPERRSGCETFTGTAFRPVPAPLHP
jgi:hypothetical protein